MMSARECIEKAERCEQMALDTNDHADRRMLRTTASHWRTLAKVARSESGYGRPEVDEPWQQ